jgi:hypothetical protein
MCLRASVLFSFKWNALGNDASFLPRSRAGCVQDEMFCGSMQLAEILVDLSLVTCSSLVRLEAYEDLWSTCVRKRQLLQC